jgi:hypothetical protein
VQLLRRQEREIFAQIESRLRAEDRQCADAGAIVAAFAALEHKAKKVVILSHAKM